MAFLSTAMFLCFRYTWVHGYFVAYELGIACEFWLSANISGQKILELTTSLRSLCSEGMT